MRKVLKLQLQNLSYIIYFPFLVWTLLQTKGVVIQFHIKECLHMGWAIQKA
jgi:hypothetical protein